MKKQYINHRINIINDLPTEEEIMLAKILTLIDDHQRKQREFMAAFDEFMREANDTLDIKE